MLHTTASSRASVLEEKGKFDSCTACAQGVESLLQLEETTWGEWLSRTWEKRGAYPFPREKQSSGAIGLHTDPDLLEVSFQVMGMNTRGINDNDSGSAPLPASLSPILTGSSSCTQKQTFLAAAWHCCLLTTMLGTKP